MGVGSSSPHGLEQGEVLPWIVPQHPHSDTACNPVPKGGDPKGPSPLGGGFLHKEGCKRGKLPREKQALSVSHPSSSPSTKRSP